MKLDKTMKHIRGTRGLSVRIAELCGIARSAVYQWKQVPAERVQEIAMILGKEPEDIRPDIFKRRGKHGKKGTGVGRRRSGSPVSKALE
jgi:DNA-binding transcriptional regulator YdaS (Cro superfamily)